MSVNSIVDNEIILKDLDSNEISTNLQEHFVQSEPPEKTKKTKRKTTKTKKTTKPKSKSNSNSSSSHETSDEDEITKDLDSNLESTNHIHEHLELVKAEPPEITKKTKTKTTKTTNKTNKTKKTSNLSSSETVLIGPLEEIHDADEIIKDVYRRKQRKSLDSDLDKSKTSTTTTTTTTTTTSSTTTSEHEHQQKEKRSFIRRMFFSQHTEDTFNQVWEIYSLFTKDLNMSTFQLLTTMHLCFLYYRDNAIHSEAYLKPTIPKDIELMEILVHYSKFAISIFGWALQEWKNMSARGILDGVWHGSKLDREVICKHTGIEDKDVLTVSWVSEYFRPGYFIAMDHSHRAIVLVVRGTFHIRDAFTDLVAHSDKFKGGLSFCLFVCFIN